ncbi:SAF domain-containing protein OS=Streptomyces alboniger OX=132473 GN=CP975_20415 PE=4 SV=1 [Streptomyces alboniger]
MKIQERMGAGSGRSAAPAQPGVGERLPSPPRERKPALAALAVLLILVGALGATVLVLRAGDRIEVIQVTKEIPAGEGIAEGNYSTVMVNDDSSANFVKKDQLEQLKALKAKSTIYPGTVVVGEMFGEKAALPAGKASVGLSLKEGQYPSDLKAGDTVAAYPVVSGTSSGRGSTGSGSGSSGGRPLVAAAKVSTVAANSDATVSTGNQNVTLLVPQDEVAGLAGAASEGKVVVVRVPSNGN